MGNLIDGLLSLARTARQETSFQAVALDKLVNNVIEELSPDWKIGHVKWKIGTLPVVQGAPDLLQQVFQNLIANALKFSRNRAPAVIEIGEIPQEGPHLLFVRDNGAGFDMKYADKLFGAFQRLHRAEEFEGTGIGLATVRRIVQRHGGRVWAEAKVDEGATFYFTLARECDGVLMKSKAESSNVF
jgi:light-regulated signal transduction histidine kinase (bacteriophytochrome)